MQLRNHEINVCYLKDVGKLVGRFVAMSFKFFSLSILYEICTPLVICCILSQLSKQSRFQVYVSELLGQSYKEKSRDCPKASGSTLNNMSCSSGNFAKNCYYEFKGKIDRKTAYLCHIIYDKYINLAVSIKTKNEYSL